MPIIAQGVTELVFITTYIKFKIHKHFNAYLRSSKKTKQNQPIKKKKNIIPGKYLVKIFWLSWQFVN